MRAKVRGWVTSLESNGYRYLAKCYTKRRAKALEVRLGERGLAKRLCFWVYKLFGDFYVSERFVAG